MSATEEKHLTGYKRYFNTSTVNGRVNVSTANQGRSRGGEVLGFKSPPQIFLLLGLNSSYTFSNLLAKHHVSTLKLPSKIFYWQRTCCEGYNLLYFRRKRWFHKCSLWTIGRHIRNTVKLHSEYFIFECYGRICVQNQLYFFF